MKILIAIHSLTYAGGIFRFERLGSILRKYGHELVFMEFERKKKKVRNIEFPILSFEEAQENVWDVVMVPGAGFPKSTVKKFSKLTDRKFGVRVQHVLNSQEMKKKFLEVNSSFKPNIVIFNNEDWPVGSFTEFMADRFHVLVGSVDNNLFFPDPEKKSRRGRNKFIIGGLANKNPEPLIQTLENLPNDFLVRLFGVNSRYQEFKYRKFIKDGRLEFMGPLVGEDLREFYNKLDCVVMTEEFAGWSNLVAEAMACELPVICTPHGTKSLAFHKQTALVIDPPEVTTIVESLKWLKSNLELGEQMGLRARKQILNFTWEDYAAKLLKILDFDGDSHYIHAPEHGLFGKWSKKTRINGLQHVIENASGRSIIDFGAAEGLVALEFYKKGAKKIHGFELNPFRVKKANTLFPKGSDIVFRVADLSSWEHFYNLNKDILKNQYDIVLYLGIQHHLSKNERVNTFVNAVKLAHKFFVIRTSHKVFKVDKLQKILESEGFSLVQSDLDNNICEHVGELRIYEKKYFV